MKPNLDDKEWDTPITQNDRYKESTDKNLLYVAPRESMVNEGYVMSKELGVKGSTRPIPPGECAITSLCRGRRWIYGATSGERAHVFAYMPEPAREIVVDMGVCEGHTDVRNALAYLPDHGVFAGTAAPEADDYDGGEILRFRRSYIGDVIQEWSGHRGETESLGVPIEGEGIAALVGVPYWNRLYGLSDESGTLFSVELPDGETRVLGKVDDFERFSPHLIVGPDGLIYACGTAGHIVRYNCHYNSIQDTGLFLPGMAGRGQYSEVGAWTLDQNPGVIYAGDVADGVLSILDVQREEVKVLGKPTAQPHIRSLVTAPDGRVYGTAGEPGKISHLFCYTPDTHELRDLGVMTAGTERRWYGYEFDCAVAGTDGRIYFGESDRISHLFVYFPPAEAVKGTEATRLRRPDEISGTGSQL